ncbi:MAG: thermonuclease family protein [Thermodesulfobacteriota bacterium]
MTKHPKYLIAIGILVVVFAVRYARVGTQQNYDTDYSGQALLIVMDKEAIVPDDGDSFFYKNRPIRILGIDTPEIVHEEHGIYEDQPYGPQAARFTFRLLKEAETVEYLPYGPDKYGRLLAHVFVDGELLAVHLLRAGLAYENVSYYGDNGYPDLAQRLLEAAENSPAPQFEQPYLWRRKHQK